jgi:hypothetical protein
MGSAIVEFSPQGEIIKHISLLDLLDPTRIGRDALDTSWTSQHVAGGQRPLDWDHANADLRRGVGLVLRVAPPPGRRRQVNRTPRR